MSDSRSTTKEEVGYVAGVHFANLCESVNRIEELAEMMGFAYGKGDNKEGDVLRRVVYEKHKVFSKLLLDLTKRIM